MPPSLITVLKFPTSEYTSLIPILGSLITLLTFPTTPSVTSFCSYTCFTNHIPHIPYINVHIPSIPKPASLITYLALPIFMYTFIAFPRSPSVPYFFYPRSHSWNHSFFDHIPHIPYVAIKFLTFPTSRSHSSHSLRHGHIPHIHIRLSSSTITILNNNTANNFLTFPTSRISDPNHNPTFDITWHISLFFLRFPSLFSFNISSCRKIRKILGK